MNSDRPPRYRRPTPRDDLRDLTRVALAIGGVALAVTAAGAPSGSGRPAHARPSGPRTVLAALLSPAKRPGPAPAPRFAGSFGQAGPGALKSPYGLAIGPGGAIWVTDEAASQVEEFTAAGRLVRAFGSGTLSQPHGIAVGPGGILFVADAGHDRVVEFSGAGRELTSFGVPGSAEGDLDDPQGLAINRSGDVYVADQGNDRVEEFDSAGRYLRSIPVPAPDGLALNSSGDLWVTSQGFAEGGQLKALRPIGEPWRKARRPGRGRPANAVYEFTPDGVQLRGFGSTQARYGALSNPAGIAVGPGGHLYVTEPDFGWVTVLNPDGGFHTEFGLQADPRRAAEDLARPEGIAIGPHGRVLVADSGNGRIAEFAVHAATPAHTAGPALWWWLLAALAAVLGAAGVTWRRRRGAQPAAVADQPTGPAADSPRLGVSRRSMLATATALTGLSVGSGVLPASLRKALATAETSPPRGGLRDIQHIVILMQENRSFDHYFGTMPGVRGFADATAMIMPNGNPVFFQPDPSHADGYLLPFHYDTKTTSAQATPGTDHTWPTQHHAWNHGRMDQWIAAKGPYTMGYFTRDDIPFHAALAEAFTICDNYHCSVLGPTDPNRCYLWTGTIDPAGTRGGPVISDAPTFRDQVMSWPTYPERLEAAGISWQVYQEEDNFDNNALAWFEQFRHAPAASGLYQRGMVARPAGTFESDATAGRLPQVSWLVAPTAQSEHPDYFPAAGAEYIAQKLDAIAANPDVWAKTAFILTYDENDGIFDHVPPPVPPAGTPGEFVNGEPIGLGFRIPTTIVSPWTAGGFVCSEVFDHTSLIRILESRFGVREPNISAWRRTTCGDLTSAFRFGAKRSGGRPNTGELGLAVTESRLVRAQQQVNDHPKPVPPKANQPLPGQ